jgi:hypothetical protein
MWDPRYLYRLHLCQKQLRTDLQGERGIIPVIQGIERADAVGGLDVGVEVEEKLHFCSLSSMSAKLALGLIPVSGPTLCGLLLTR